jgi:AcrR family transcriptional regulator
MCRAVFSREIKEMVPRGRKGGPKPDMRPVSAAGDAATPAVSRESGDSRETETALPAPKFRRRAEARPDEVLDAALALFTEKGFAAARVDEIAKRAGISKGAVYLYFPSKEALFEAIIHRALGPIAEEALEQIASLPGNPRLIISSVLRVLALRLGAAQALAIPRLVIHEAPVFPEIAILYRRAVLDRVIPALTALIRRGVAEGHFRQIDPELTVRSVIGPVLMHMVLAEIFSITPADGLALDRLIENHIAILFDGLSLAGEGQNG